MVVKRRLVGREVMHDGAGLLLLERGHDARHERVRVRRRRGSDAGLRGGGIIDVTHELGVMMILLMLYVRLLLTVLDELRQLLGRQTVDRPRTGVDGPEWGAGYGPPEFIGGQDVRALEMIHEFVKVWDR